jgi:hypothetical protein
VQVELWVAIIGSHASSTLRSSDPAEMRELHGAVEPHLPTVNPDKGAPGGKVDR